MWWYTLGVLVLWVVNPELRRLFDWRFGAAPVDVFPLLPFLAVMPHIWSLTYGGGWQRLARPLAIAAWIWVGAFGYAFIAAFFNGNALPGAYGFANFVLPGAVGLWIAADTAPFLQAYSRVTRLLFGLTTIVSIYGIVQYVFAPPWDTLWLEKVIAAGSLSFGRPAPFLIRVFSMLSSPGPFGSFLAVMLLLALPQLRVRRPWLLVQLPIWLVALGLSLDRSAWLLFVSGALVYLVLTPRRGAFVLSAGLSAALLAGLVFIIPAALGNQTILTTLTARFASFTDLENDRSGNDRRTLYESGARMTMDAPFGRGLGVFGTATKLGDASSTTDFDSGVLARLVEMGIPGTALLVIGLGLLAAGIGRVWHRAGIEKDARLQSIAAMALAVELALVGSELSGDVGGLSLLVLWAVAGLVLRNEFFIQRRALTLAYA